MTLVEQLRAVAPAGEEDAGAAETLIALAARLSQSQEGIDEAVEALSHLSMPYQTIFVEHLLQGATHQDQVRLLASPSLQAWALRHAELLEDELASTVLSGRKDRLMLLVHARARHAAPAAPQG